MSKKCNKIISLVLSISLLFSISLTATSASANENINIQITNKNVEVVDTLEVEENESIQLSTIVTNGSLPEGSSLVWSTQTPYLASVSQKGLVTGIDSSKGAILRIWIDTKVATVPVVGDSIAKELTNRLDKYHIDKMNTDDIVKTMRIILIDLLGKKDDAVVNYLLTALEDALNNINNTIKCAVVDSDGNELTSDSVEVLVKNSSKFYSDFVPNGTYITNKTELPTKVAVGYETQLTGITTPLRTNMGVNWSIKTDILNRNVAEIDKDGNIKFLKPGKVTVIASPDMNQFMNSLRDMMKKAESVGEKVNGEFVAKVLVEVMNVDIDEEFMAKVINKLAGTHLSDDDFINFIMDHSATIGNFILKMTTNDKITFNVVNNIPVENFKITGNTVIKDGEKSQLSIDSVEPKGSVVKNVKWEVSNPNIVNVTQDGLITGRDSGYIGKNFSIAATIDEEKRSVSGTVKGIVNKFIPTDVEIVYPTDKIYVGDKINLKYNVYPSTLFSSFKKATWGLIVDGKETFGGNLNDGIVAINQKGEVTGVGEGTTTILCRANKNKDIVEKINITVNYKNDKLTIKQGDYVKVDIPKYGLYTGKTVKLDALINGKPVNSDDVEWSSSEWTIKVDDEGKVKCTTIFVKSAVITVKTKDGKYSASTKVSFTKKPVESIKISESSITLYAGNSKNLDVDFNPSDVTIENLEWTSSDEDVVKVDKDGKVTAVAPGCADITVKSFDGGFSATCEVNVPGSDVILYENKAAPEHIWKKVRLFSKYQKNPIQLKCAYNKQNSPYTDIKWYSSSDKIKVDNNGKCTPTINRSCMSWITVVLKDSNGNQIRSTIKVEFYKF